MDAHGAVRSIQAADVTMPERASSSELWTPTQPRAPRAHLLAVPLARDARPDPRRLHRRRARASCCCSARSCCCASTRPSTRSTRDRGIVRWRIENGLLVARAGAAATATSRSTSAAAPPTSRATRACTSRSRSRTSTRRSRSRIARWFYTQHAVADPRARHARLPALARAARPRGVGGRPLRAAARRAAPATPARSPSATPWRASPRSPRASRRGGSRSADAR